MKDNMNLRKFKSKINKRISVFQTTELEGSILYKEKDLSKSYTDGRSGGDG